MDTDKYTSSSQLPLVLSLLAAVSFLVLLLVSVDEETTTVLCLQFLMNVVHFTFFSGKSMQ